MTSQSDRALAALIRSTIPGTSIEWLCREFPLGLMPVRIHFSRIAVLRGCQLPARSPSFRNMTVLATFACVGENARVALGRVFVILGGVVR